MAWIEPQWDKGGIVDVNKELALFKGELDEEKAKHWLGQFLMYNIQFTTEILFGVKLHPRQAVLLKSWFHCNYNLAVWGRGSGKTLSYHTNTKLLAKDIGIIPITDLLPNLSFEKEGWKDIDPIYLWNGNDWQKTDKIYIQPKKKCRRVTTNNGYFLEGSTNHLIKVLDFQTCSIVWKKFSEIKNGDRVCISRNEIDYSFSDFSERESYFLGLLAGDGSYTSKSSGACLTTIDQEIIDWVYNNWEIMSYTKKKKSEAIDIKFSTKLIKPLFDKYNIKRTTSYDKVIPQKILACRKSLKFYLMGLFDTDGTCYKTGSISYCSTSEELVKQIHLSLLSFGIISRFYKRKTLSNFGKAWYIDISGENVDIFNKKIGFRLSRKQSRANIEKKRNTNIDVIPGAKEFFQREIKAGQRLTKTLSDEWRNNIRRKKNQKHLSYSTLANYLEFAKKAGFDEKKYENLLEIQKENFFFDEIVDIEDFDHDCLDFNVPNGEMYWANGFINHNSTLVGLWAVLDCVFNPGTHTLIVSQNFRSSRRILENLEKLSNSPEGVLFKQCLDGDLSRRNDIFKYTFINGSTITAVPLSGGEGLRGLRCSRLIIDEALLLSLGIIETILKPFLVSGGNIKEKLQLRELEDKLISRGFMREEDREIFASTSKMILLSSASYQWEDLFKVYKQYLKNIETFEEKDLKVATYSVTQVSYRAIPKDLLDPGIIKDVESGDISQNVVDREYGAIFVSDSSGYFKASKMAECTVPDGQRPCVEIVGEKGAEYVLGIDISLSSGEASDDFAMSVLKIVDKGDKKIGMLVHSYAVAGGAHKDHVAYLHYILTNFNIVYIGVDASQGDNEFTAQANETKLFKDSSVELRDIDAEFNKNDQTDISKQVAKSYNLQARRIVHKQGFSSSWQRMAAEYLQACIDYKNILFAGKAGAVDGLADEMSRFRPNILDTHPYFKDSNGNSESVYSFIEHQDFLIDLTKKECALIEVTSTPSGGQSFDLPSSMKRSTSKTRAKKDNFSSLMLANWCLRVYLESKALPVENSSETFTFFFAR
jgi:intein/homing endonuclease